MNLRDRLVEVALEWQRRYGVAPHITAQLSEYDAAHLVGMPEDQYGRSRQRDTAVKQGHDFLFDGIRYQVKANRPSGKPGSTVTLVGKARNYEWDRLIWILYDPLYVLQEAWEWRVDAYRQFFDDIGRLRPEHMRQGRPLHRPLPASIG